MEKVLYSFSLYFSFLVDNEVEQQERSEYDSVYLHSAARWGNISAIELLVEGGCNVEERDENARTPLLIAIMSGHTDAARSLIGN